MKTVYYSPALDPEIYFDEYLLYQEPDSLYKDMLKDKEKSNDFNNYLDCPSVLKFMQNTFVIRSPYNCKLDLDYTSGKFLHNGQVDKIAEHFKPRPSCRTDHYMFNLHHNFVFFCEEELETSTVPAYMHDSEFQSKARYIPGTYDISKWFRMIDGAFEMKSPIQELNLAKGDPLYYVKFHTSDQVKLVRFELTPDIWKLMMGCIHYKQYQPRKPLAFLYKLFAHAGMNKIILKKIKENIIE